jgi:hypothetical protein
MSTSIPTKITTHHLTIMIIGLLPTITATIHPRAATTIITHPLTLTLTTQNLPTITTTHSISALVSTTMEAPLLIIMAAVSQAAHTMILTTDSLPTMEVTAAITMEPLIPMDPIIIMIHTGKTVQSTALMIFFMEVPKSTRKISRMIHHWH